MKKILSFILVLSMLLLLVGCKLPSFEMPSIDVYAPSITENEADFIGMVAELKTSTVAIYNDDVTPVRYGTGILLHKEGDSNLIYYVLTTQSNVKDTDEVTVYLAQTQSVVGTVIGRKDDYATDEDIALIRITVTSMVTPLELTPLADIDSVKYKTIFSIGTVINVAYFNFLTNPAQVMGIQNHLIVHGTNLNPGQIGSGLFLKQTGQLIGINISISSVTQERPEVLINRAISINKVIELVEEMWS